MVHFQVPVGDQSPGGDVSCRPSVQSWIESSYSHIWCRCEILIIDYASSEFHFLYILYEVQTSTEKDASYMKVT